MWWMVFAAVAAALQPSAEPEAFRLAVNPAFAMSPGAFRAVALIEPSPDNEWLVVRMDSMEYYRSSTVQLNGAAAARRHMMIFEHLPPGKYRVEAVLKRTHGRRLVRDFTVQVRGIPSAGR